MWVEGRVVDEDVFFWDVLPAFTAVHGGGHAGFCGSGRLLQDEAPVTPLLGDAAIMG